MDYLRIISGLSRWVTTFICLVVHSRHLFMLVDIFCVTQDSAVGLRSFCHLITMEWLVTNSLKIKLCRWCPGALCSRTSTAIWCLNLQFQIAKAILFLFLQGISDFKWFASHGTVTRDVIKCLVIISTWSNRQNKALVRAKPSAIHVIDGHFRQHTEDSRTRL